MRNHSTRRFLPFGAGSSGVIGDRVYVTVRVTTCRTLTGLFVAERGESYILLILSAFQSAEENGDRIEWQLLWGESDAGDHRGDCGILRRLRPVGVRAEFGGRMYGEGGMMGADMAVLGAGSCVTLQQQDDALFGCVIGVVLPEWRRSKTGLRPVDGVDSAGERALRKSM